MKIAVPWPIKIEGQPRIRESLGLWTHEPHLCLAEPCDPALDQFSHSVMPRNSKDIGGTGKCYILDMIRSLLEFDQDWYGFCNSDCVPVGDLIDDQYEVLIYHRTNIRDWKFMDRNHNEKSIPKDLWVRIWKMRSRGYDDKAIAQCLNVDGTPPPRGAEWTYVLIQQLFAEQGGVFMMGQDMYLFRKDVLPRIIEEYLLVKDPIIGTGGFDPRLTHWCIGNFKTARVINKLYHKMHDSEWAFEDVECQHNGGKITEQEHLDYCTGEFINLCQIDGAAAIPHWFIHLIRIHRPKLYQQLVNSSNI